MTEQLIIGASGLLALILGMAMHGHRLLGACLVGAGIGAAIYALLLQVTTEPLDLVLDFASRVVG